MKPITIYLDFDGTMVEHKYPAMGREVDYAVETVKALQKVGHLIVLNTYRADLQESNPMEAIEWLHNKGIQVTKVMQSKRKPEPFLVRKEFVVYNDPTEGNYIYIDDISPGIPLIHGSVDWRTVKKELNAAKLFEPTSNEKKSNPIEGGSLKKYRL